MRCTVSLMVVDQEAQERSLLEMHHALLYCWATLGPALFVGLAPKARQTFDFFFLAKSPTNPESFGARNETTNQRLRLAQPRRGNKIAWTQDLIVSCVINFKCTCGPPQVYAI